MQQLSKSTWRMLQVLLPGAILFGVVALNYGAPFTTTTIAFAIGWAVALVVGTVVSWVAPRDAASIAPSAVRRTVLTWSAVLGLTGVAVMGVGDVTFGLTVVGASVALCAFTIFAMKGRGLQPSQK